MLGLGVGLRPSLRHGRAPSPPPVPDPVVDYRGAPQSAPRGAGPWKFPGMMLMPGGSTGYAIVSGGAVASISAAGEITWDTTEALDQFPVVYAAVSNGVTYLRWLRLSTYARTATAGTVHRIASQAEFDALTIASGDIVEIASRMNERLTVSGRGNFLLRSASWAASVEAVTLAGACPNIALEGLVVGSLRKVDESLSANAQIALGNASVGNIRIEGCAFYRMVDGANWIDTSDQWSAALVNNYHASGFEGGALAGPTPISVDIDEWGADAPPDLGCNLYAYRKASGAQGTLTFRIYGPADQLLGTFTLNSTNGTVTKFSGPDGVRIDRVEVSSSIAGTGWEFYVTMRALIPSHLSSSGACYVGNLTYRNNLLAGAFDGIKPGFRHAAGTRTTVTDNVLLACYQDVIAFGAWTDVDYVIERNVMQRPFYYNVNKGPGAWWVDPGDPHGDGIQMYSGTGGETANLVLIAGNLILPFRLLTAFRGSPLPTANRSQSDIYLQARWNGGQDLPQYRTVLIVGNVLGGGGGAVDASKATLSYVAGNVGYAIYPTTEDTEMVSFADDYAPNGNAVGLQYRNVSPNFGTYLAGTDNVLRECLSIDQGTPSLNYPAVFAGWTGVPAVAAVADWKAAGDVFAPAAGAAAEGLGPFGFDCFDRDPAAPDHGIRWSNLPAFTEFPLNPEIDPGTAGGYATSPARRMVTGTVARTVTPESGVEWRWGTDHAACQAAPWQAGAGTVTPAAGQFGVDIQVRYPIDDSIGTVRDLGFTCDGIHSRFRSVTASAFPALTARKPVGADGTILADATGPSDLVSVTFLWEGRLEVATTGSDELLIGLHDSGAAAIRLTADMRSNQRKLRARMFNSAGTLYGSGAVDSATGVVPVGQNTRILYTATQNTGSGRAVHRCFIDGVMVLQDDRPSSGTGVFPVSRYRVNGSANLGLTLGRSRVWYGAWQPDGNMPGGAPDIDQQGDLSYWNAGGGTGFAKVGAGSYVAPP